MQTSFSSSSLSLLLSGERRLISNSSSSSSSSSSVVLSIFLAVAVFLSPSFCPLAEAFSTTRYRSTVAAASILQSNMSSNTNQLHRTMPSSSSSALTMTSSSDEIASMTTATSTTSSSSGITEPLDVGFIGFGTIAAAIATGLATSDQLPVRSLSISRRSESKSTVLKDQHPELVTVYDNNQDILDKSTIIFVCVLPQQTSEVLQQLQFDSTRHTVVSLVSTSTLDGLADDTKLPSENIFKCICLPSVARQEGICLLTPKLDHPVLIPLLDGLGGVVQAKDEEQMSAMMVPSGLMGSMYGMLKQSRDWLVDNGDVSKSDASYLVGKFFWGMMQDAERICKEEDAFEELIEEQTPGGLNEQALRNWGGLGALDSLDRVQDALFDRIKGESDGTL